MEAADEFVEEDAIIPTKKPSGSVPTNIALHVDRENMRIILPRESFLEKPDFYMFREESFIKECLQAAFSESDVQLHQHTRMLIDLC